VAYATGSTANLTGLLDAIQTFAAGQGWTVEKWTPGSNLLFLSKGICHVAMQGGTFAYNDYATGAQVAKTDTTLRMAISTSINPALTTFFGHPGGFVTSATAGDRIEVNDLAGPFTAYHLFGTGNYIHVVVQTDVRRWQHFSIGLLDQGSLTHSGAAYAMGGSHWFWRAGSGSTPYAVDNSANWFNRIDYANIPFAAPMTVAITTNEIAARHIYIPDALPVGWSTISADHVPNQTLYQMALMTRRNDPSLWNSGNDTGNLLSGVLRSTVSQWGGNLVLWSMPMILRFGISGTTQCYVGDYPDVRLCNMEGLNQGQEIQLGSDTWMVFPAGRQTPWGTQAQVGLQFSTGQYALAYKKVP
jgi:hypothetical protein